MITVIKISKKHCRMYNNDMMNSAQRSEGEFSDYMLKTELELAVNNQTKAF